MSTNDTDLEHGVDVGSQRVAEIYAEALLNAAQKQGQSDAVVDELDEVVGGLFKADPQFEAFLASNSVNRERKEQVIRKAFDGRASNVLTDFLLVLNRHERLSLLRPIRAEARRLQNERARRLPVLVRSAVPLPDDQRDRLREQLRQAFQQEPLLETRVDPDLLGGLVVRVGDWVYDSSVRTQLDNIRNQLIERSSYEIQSGRDRFSLAE